MGVRCEEFIGKPVDGLNLSERWSLSGKWIATELYSPERLPLRIIQVVGSSARDCVKQLQARGLDAALYHYELVEQPYEP
ncbi:MAG: hypothetical protein JO061_23360 [Acidobacteriaceae bacterium]|nr:hypothetical protein [Acidobacteriaceae bacterium]